MANEVVKKSEIRSQERGEMVTPKAGSSGDKSQQEAETVSNVDKERERERGHEGESSKKSARWEGT